MRHQNYFYSSPLPLLLLLLAAPAEAQRGKFSYLDSERTCLGPGCVSPIQCRANATQPFKLCGATGEQMVFDTAGPALGIATTAPATEFQIGSAFTAGSMVQPGNTRRLWAAISVSDTSSHPAGLFGVEQKSASGGVQVLEGFGVSNNSTGTMALGMAVVGNFQHIGAGTLTEARGTSGSGQATAGTVTHLTGVMGSYGIQTSASATNAYAFRVRAPFDTSSGSITNGFGLYIDNVIGTTDWGVYQSDASDANFFAGPTTLNDILTLTPKGTAPATCSIGDFYVDTSGAACACSATNTWSNMHGTGSCV